MLNALQSAFKVKEVRERLLYTFTMLVVIRKDATGSNITEISILQYCPAKCDLASQSHAK